MVWNSSVSFNLLINVIPSVTQSFNYVWHWFWLSQFLYLVASSFCWLKTIYICLCSFYYHVISNISAGYCHVSLVMHNKMWSCVVSLLCILHNIWYSLMNIIHCYSLFILDLLHQIFHTFWAMSHSSPSSVCVWWYRGTTIFF